MGKKFFHRNFKYSGKFAQFWPTKANLQKTCPTLFIMIYLLKKAQIRSSKNFFRSSKNLAKKIFSFIFFVNLYWQKILTFFFPVKKIINHSKMSFFPNLNHEMTGLNIFRHQFNLFLSILANVKRNLHSKKVSKLKFSKLGTRFPFFWF